MAPRTGRYTLNVGAIDRSLRAKRPPTEFYEQEEVQLNQAARSWHPRRRCGPNPTAGPPAVRRIGPDGACPRSGLLDVLGWARSDSAA